MKMIEINLLPKNYRKKSFDFSMGKSGLYFIAAAASVIICLIAVTIFQVYQLSELDTNIEKANERAEMLKKDIALVDALTVVKEKIHKRMSAVEKLDSHRSAWIRILEDMSKNVPEFVWLGKFEEKPIPKPDATKPTARTQPNQAQAQTQAQTPETSKPTEAFPLVREATVEGYAFTLNSLASFMIKMMRSDYFDEVELKSTEEKVLQEKKAYNFVISCNVHYLSDEELRDLIASSGDNNNTKVTTSSQKNLN